MILAFGGRMIYFSKEFKVITFLSIVLFVSFVFLGRNNRKLTV